jgi:signal transduction histidine kinase
LALVSINTWKAHSHPDDLKQSEEKLERHYSGELTYYDCECRMKHKDGHWVWVHDRGRVISRTSDGKPLMMFGTHTDITERKKAEEEIKLKNEELQKLNASKDKFFSIIAHDLRGPFNAIEGFSIILSEQISEKNYEGIETFAQIIKKTSRQTLDLLTNLLDWSLSQSGRMEFNPGFVELVSLIGEVTLAFLDMAAQKGITIRKVLPQSAPLYADKNMISTVLRNLISNALKYTRQNGTVIISVEKQKNELTISVSDTGVGLSKSRIDNLFRIDKSYSTPGTQKEKGTGLGLILCKDFVEKHSGKIWVESEEENLPSGKAGGSTFYFSLPFQPELK